jgi:phosphoglycerol transferase MdoB-like AlkP superfamily enzyme
MVMGGTKVAEENTTRGDGLSSFLRRRSVWLLLMVALIWAVELFCVQAMSFCFDYPAPVMKRLGAQTVRLLLDVTFCLGWVALLPRSVTIIGFIGFVIFAQIAGYYDSVFGRALTLTTMQAQWVEGFAGAQFDWAYINKTLLLVMMVVLALKTWLLQRVGDCRRSMRWAGMAAWGSYALLAVLAMGWIDPAKRLRTYVTGDRLGMTYGFGLLWAGEAVYLHQDRLLGEAVAQRAHVTDRLSAIEPPVALTGNIVLIQVESLDWRVLKHRVNGAPVTPFLNRLAEEAMLFKITVFHENGSCDADFVMLNAVPPSPTVMTYALARYPYRETLPQIAERAGYTTAAFHGNTGRFFSREQAFRRMGFGNFVVSGRDA